MGSGEAQARQLFYTNEFVREELDLDDGAVRVDFEPDTFGHPDTIPKLLDNADVDYYYLGRSGGTPPDKVSPDAYQGCTTTIPSCSAGRAKTDRASWCSTRATSGYNGHVDPENVTNVFDFEEESGLRDYLNLYGVGDHGGGPTREDVRTIIEMNEWPVFPRRSVTPSKGTSRRSTGQPTTFRSSTKS